MQIILYASTYADLLALQKYRDSGIPVELFSAPMTDDCIQVIIDLDEYTISPTATGYDCTPIKPPTGGS